MAGPLKRLTIGRLRHQLQVQIRAGSSNGFGEVAATWAGRGDPIWGKVEPVSGMGQELPRNGTVQGNVTHKVTTRFRTDIDPTMRMLWLGSTGGLALNIVSVLPMTGDENWLEIWCRSEWTAPAPAPTPPLANGSM